MSKPLWASGRHSSAMRLQHHGVQADTCATRRAKTVSASFVSVVIAQHRTPQTAAASDGCALEHEPAASRENSSQASLPCAQAYICNTHLCTHVSRACSVFLLLQARSVIVGWSSYPKLTQSQLSCRSAVNVLFIHAGQKRAASGRV